MRKKLAFFPPEININLLQENGKLLDEATISQLKIKLETAHGRFSKKILKTPYGIIQNETGLYAIYRDVNDNNQFELGHGKFGAVKLAQSLDTGEWYILKTQQNVCDSWVFYNECQSTEALKKSYGQALFRVSKDTKKGIKGNLLLKYEPGISLFQLMKNRRFASSPEHNWPDLLWLEIAIDALKSLQKNVHDLYHLHRDIKLENFIVDIIGNNLKAKVVDFGFAQPYKPKNLSKSVKSSVICGTYPYIAPEILHAHKEKKTIIFNESTEIYACGVMLYEIFFNKISDADKHYKLFFKANINPEDNTYKKSKLRKNQDLHQLLGEMRYLDSQKRPRLTSVITQLEEIRKNHEKAYPDEQVEINKILALNKKIEKERLDNINLALFLLQSSKNLNTSIKLDSIPEQETPEEIKMVEQPTKSSHNSTEMIANKICISLEQVNYYNHDEKIEPSKDATKISTQASSLYDIYDTDDHVKQHHSVSQYISRT